MVKAVLDLLSDVSILLKLRGLDSHSDRRSDDQVLIRAQVHQSSEQSTVDGPGTVRSSNPVIGRQPTPKGSAAGRERRRETAVLEGLGNTLASIELWR